MTTPHNTSNTDSADSTDSTSPSAAGTPRPPLKHKPRGRRAAEALRIANVLAPLDQPVAPPGLDELLLIVRTGTATEAQRTWLLTVLASDGALPGRAVEGLAQRTQLSGGQVHQNLRKAAGMIGDCRSVQERLRCIRS